MGGLIITVLDSFLDLTEICTKASSYLKAYKAAALGLSYIPMQVACYTKSHCRTQGNESWG